MSFFFLSYTLRMDRVFCVISAAFLRVPVFLLLKVIFFKYKRIACLSVVNMQHHALAEREQRNGFMGMSCICFKPNGGNKSMLMFV